MEFAQRLLSTRRGSTVLGITAAAVAGILLLVYLSQYKNSLNSSAEPINVLVANSLIQKGTPGDAVGSQGLSRRTRIRKDQVITGAFTDASSLEGKVARSDIFPGQQLTAADFVAASASTISTKLSGDQRAIAIPLDSAHGLIGQIHPGDHVDVLAGFNVQQPTGAVSVIKTLMVNALVLDAPAKSARGIGSGDTNVVVRATSNQSAQIAFAADNGKLWLVQRPSLNAGATKPSLVTAQSLLAGVRPLVVKGAGQ
jgi:Flp pilus assembly protein CpaB